MLRTIATAALALGLLAGIACGDNQGGSDRDIVEVYAQCLADPSTPLHELAGSPTYDEALEGVRADLASGENTLEDVEAAYTLYCG